MSNLNDSLLMILAELKAEVEQGKRTVTELQGMISVHDAIVSDLKAVHVDSIYSVHETQKGFVGAISGRWVPNSLRDSVDEVMTCLLEAQPSK